MKISKQISDRPMSGFPVSVGTGLALETIFNPITEVIDESRKVTKLEDKSKYTYYLFNIVTLTRNIINSAASIIDLTKIDPKDVYAALTQEIDFITDFFSSNELKVIMYINDMQQVKNKYSTLKGKLRTATTSKQLLHVNIIDYCIKHLNKENDTLMKFVTDLYVGDMFGDKGTNILVNTHVPYDLLSYTRFRTLDLLESHTGAIKSISTFNTKYYPIPNKDMSFLPFTEKLLAAFGDHVTFKPDPLKERLELYESLLKQGVNPLTPENKL